MSPRFAATLIFASILSALLAGCIEDAPEGQKVPVYGYRVVAVYTHDPEAFTQGLAYRDGILYEGTGLYWGSKLCETRLETGEVVRSRNLPPQLFGEGIVLWEDRLVQLTWRSGIGLVWDLENLTVVKTFSYSTEGWGIASDGRSLIMSDGTSELRFLDPETFEVKGGVEVVAEGQPLQSLNELEYVDGLIYANVWKTDMIAIISPETGEVVGWIDLSGLLTEEERLRADVLNGIAYDPESGHLLVTGKLWPKIFQIEVVASE
ncbi:MAG TPA: glutaminyl-peptide cyclotransferase [Methanothrix sp.]|nr:glutaminyl-peptide cyclotransferase [Methanothrix sp.]HPJ85140.1 glutaminyl-peptide cyclotransferase [Methanothrix sp.]HPR66553.1 glutaminyl-peptide cyclotransferase [Methanothrix sp.]